MHRAFFFFFFKKKSRASVEAPFPPLLRKMYTFTYYLSSPHTTPECAPAGLEMALAECSMQLSPLDG